MYIMSRMAVLVLLCSLTIGCKKQFSYEELLENPEQLRVAFQNCQTLTDKTQNEAKQCEVVMKAASNLINELTEQQEHPELFGKNLMDMELACVSAKKMLILARQDLASLKNKKAPKNQIQVAEETVNQAEKTLGFAQQKVKIMLAALGLNSPE